MADHNSSKNKELFLEAFKNKAGNIAQSCKAVNIARQTFYNWCNTDPVFHREYLDVKEELVDYAEATLLTLIKEKNATATIFFLKTQGKHRGYTE